MERKLPAYPLFIKDPYFSIWAQTEQLNEKDVIFWTGEEKKISGFIKVGNEVYRFLGKGEGLKAEQTGLTLTAFTTDYVFRAGGVQLKLSFVSPLPPNDLFLLSCPVCYVKYEITGGDAEIIFAIEQSLCYNGKDFRPVRGAVIQMNGFKTAFFGLKRQYPLSNASDRLGADWGYRYLSGEKAFFIDEEAYYAYLGTGIGPSEPYREGTAWLVSSSKSSSGKVMFGFDDTVSVKYFGDFLRGYYLENHTIYNALQETFDRSAEIDVKLAEFHEKLMRDSAAYGENYQNILIASLRQSVGAHKAVKNRKGELVFLSKECFSNGCVGTVDVSYPSVPLYLLYYPELVRGMMRPVFEFARMSVWKYDFAPHDVGAYPDCCGQVYGLRENAVAFGNLSQTDEAQTRFPIWQLPASVDLYNIESQMPVEECANMLIMLTAVYRCDGDCKMAEQEFALLERWADYLVKNGLKPQNQLCTDDFAGHMKNNLNLAVKATVGIACFAELCKALQNEEKYKQNRNTALLFAEKISRFSEKFTHMPLTWDEGEDSYSLKYNLAFDRILGLGLFSDELREREVDYYLKKANRYGIPLDSRADFTKSDWLIWTACLTQSQKKRKKIIDSVDSYLRNSEDRLPFGDWYDTKTGRLIGFRNRTVQGGCFMLLLDKMFTEKEKEL